MPSRPCWTPRSVTSNAGSNASSRRRRSLPPRHDFCDPYRASARFLRPCSLSCMQTCTAGQWIAEMPELGRMTSGEAAAMTGLAPVPHDSGTMGGRRAIAGGRRALRHVLFQAALAAACHNPVLKPVAQRLKMRGKPHKLVIVAIARRLVTIANAIPKTGVPWQNSLVT